jgi:ABC-type multidrug transport system ATPase subunit
MTDYALTLNEVCVARALVSVSFGLLPGEIIGVVGPAGAGKTTLLRVAAGLLAPDAGAVWASGAVGYAPEAPVFPPALTVREVLAYYARFHATGAMRRTLVHDALELGGLAAVANTRAASLGRADLQRLALAQATLGGRRVLLLDETLSGLDPLARRDLCSRVAHIAATGVAVLLAARDLGALERVAGRVLVLRAGRVVRAGPLASLLAERVLEVVLDHPPPEPPPGFRVTATGLEAPLAGRTPEAALALCRAHRLAVRASRVRIKSLEEIVLDAHDSR